MRMERKWTEEQLQAITERGRNILVSAGAGSGKTAVMVERAVRLIMEDRVPVNSMLIVTFTRAAAGEMRERLRKALKDRLIRITGDEGSGAAPEEQKWIKEQLDQLHTAQISTFHSFAERVMKEFFYYTDIEPGFRVLDEAEAEVLRTEALDTLFNEEYERKDEDFTAFMDSYSGEKNDLSARDMVSSLYSKLEAVPDRFRVLEDKVSDLDKDTEAFRNTETFRRLIALLRKEAEACAGICSRARGLLSGSGLGRLSELLGEDESCFAGVCAALDAGDIDHASELLRGRRFATIRVRKDEKDLYDDDLKSRVDALRGRYKERAKQITAICYDSLDHMVKAMRMASGHARTLARLVRRFDDIYSESKRDLNAVDYSDMEHSALAILGHEEACQYYRDLFRYIFIDEYQDTNIMQETIVGKIRRDDDLFMVGDIKQSIYHFRLADPDIFKARYEAYREEGSKGEEAESVKIDLNRNFRSKPAVIEEINNIFRPIMEGYDSSQELICGVEQGEHALGRPETHIIDISGSDESEDDEIADLHKEELEAQETANIIKKVLGQEYTDPSSGETRKVGYRDIVILMRSVKRSAEGYRAVFRDEGIPLYIDDRAGYFDTIEINVFLSLLSVLDNRRQDVHFIALLRSEIFGFTVEELAEIRKLHMTGSFVDAAMDCAENEEAPGRLREKCRKAFDDIKRWQAYAVTLPLPDLIWRLMNETGYYIVAGTFPGGAERQANLRLLADRAREYSERSFGSLYGFIQYIETVKQNQVDIPQATLLSENDNVVRIMTIHHSKGLEFPVVIVAGMDNMHGDSKTASLLFDREDGLGLRTVDPERHLYEDGLISRMIKAKDRRCETEELQRVFYVAVTRARETFYLVGAADYNKIINGLDTGKHADSTLLRMSEYLPGIVSIPAADLAEQLEAHEADDDTDGSEMPERAAGERGKTSEIIDRLGFSYPYEEVQDIAAKTTVTRINEMKRSYRAGWQGEEENSASVREMTDEEEMPRDDWEEPGFMSGDRRISSARRGTAYHSVMEEIDFTRASEEGTDYICSCMDDMVRRGLFTEEEMKAVDPVRIKMFFDSDLGKRAVKASASGQLWKEQTFESKIGVKGEDVLVQGVIDCCFMEDDGMVLLDYKTNRVNKAADTESETDRIKSIYRTQLEVYADALAKASGSEVKEKYLYLFSLDREVKVEG